MGWLRIRIHHRPSMLRHHSQRFPIRCVTFARATLITLAACVVTASASAQDTRSLTLRDILGSSLARHPLAGAAEARVRAARGARTTARSFGNPVLSYDVENAPFPGGSAMPAMPRETMATATLPLESIVQHFPRARSADATVRAAEADARAARQRLALDASRAFFRAALAQVSVAAARDLTAWLDSVVAYNRHRVEEGVTAEADLIRAELERDRAATDATLQEADLARARAELAAFLDRRAPSGADIVVAIDDAPIAMPSALELPAAGGSQSDLRVRLARRPDVLAARERLSAAGASVTTERTMIVRELGATFGAKRTAGTTSMMAGVSLPLPIFDPNRGEVARATAERDAAALELAARERAASAEVAGAYEAARLLTERATLLAKGTDGRPPLLARADEGRRIALGAYREGAVSLLHVIDAARAWSEARITFYQALYAQHESIAALLVARGDDLLAELPRLAAGAHADPSR
jgi:cobalt-zinc-cadmium efflux system outer membrane protein